MSTTAPTTLAEKVWNRHVVRSAEGEPDLLYIDLHLVHEVTSPQAFDGLRMTGRTVRRPDLTLATEDHNVPTADIDQPIADPVSRKQVETLRANAAEFGIINYPMGSAGQGIVHVIGPGAGLHPAGHDHRVRRLPHLHPRRLRRAGLRHRHLRGRARARHPDPAPGTGPGPWRSTSTASCARASPPRTSSWRSSGGSAPRGGIGHIASTAAPPSGPSRWRAA